MSRAAAFLALLVVVVAPASRAAESPTPFDDAAALWHMSSLKNAAPGGDDLAVRGNVGIGVELTGDERHASVLRGGDGRAARFDGGYLDAGGGPDGRLNLKANAFTLCIRLRDPSGRWMAPLFSKHGGHDKLVYNLFSHDFGAGKVIGFEIGTERTRGMTQVSVPLSIIGETDWHDIICRYNGAKLQLFVDGVWMDEEFPMGPLRQGNTEPCLIGAESVGGAVKSGWRGLVDHAALWSRALSDAEIEALSGGAREVASKKLKYLGPLPSMQYFRPHNRFNVGDTLPFFHDGTFHFYYLLDRGHHSAKGGKGAHQWAHVSSRDLINWTEHPLAVPITREEEGSICTGSMFFHDGVWYAFYATRLIGKGEQISVATGRDGIHFTKIQPDPLFTADAKYHNGFRDPHVFRDDQTGLFHMLISTMLKDGNRGCLAHYTSRDLKKWIEAEPFLIEGKEVPECPDYFRWNGRYYLIFSFGQVARYRMSTGPLGPWEKPKLDILDGGAARVMKTAAFTGNRRIGTASIWPFGYAGWAVFRELVQNPDGTLGSRFVPEMIPPSGEPASLTFTPLGDGAAGDAQAVRLRAVDGSTQAMLTGLPRNARIQLRISAKAASLGLRLRASLDKPETHEIRIIPGQRRLSVIGGQSISLDGDLDKPITLDIILKDQILDLCINQQQTLVNWVPDLRGDRLIFFAGNGGAIFEQISVRPLR